MPLIATIILFALSVIFVILTIIYVAKEVTKLKNQKEEALKEAKKIVSDAKALANEELRNAKLNIKEMEIKLKEDADREINSRRNEISLSERRLYQKEEQINKKEERLEEDQRKLSVFEKELEKRDKELQGFEEERKEKLLEVANLTRDEAKDIILGELEEELVKEKAEKIRMHEEDLKDKSKKMACEIISTAIQRCAADHTSESTVSVVQLPNDEIKGRIIGKEGRNIRSIEMLTGVQLIIDDTPEAITISAFDPVRRAVAQRAIERLIEDGRIQPAKIEEMVDKAVEEIDEIVTEEGKRAVVESGIDHLPSEIVRLLGKLKYRTSYGQNVLTHSIEVANLCRIMAGLVGANQKIAARAGLLHDLGKALDHDPQIVGTHVELGVEVLKRHNESQVVINAVEAHHGDVEPQSVEAILVQAADAISASRPGARRDTFEAYIKRLENLENIAKSFEGVEKSYALQAGREIRLIVSPEKVSDDEMEILARDVAKRIENEVAFPGQIKVNVLRETRKTDYAKQSKVNRN